MTIIKKENSILKVALKMAVPSMVESFFVAFAGLVDAFMVSSLGSDAIASVGLTAQPKFVGLAVFIALGVSNSALVARRFGEGDRERANSIAVTAFAIMLFMSVVISTLFVIFAPQIISLCGSTPETHDGAVTYLRIIMGGIIFNCIQIGINTAQRGAGNTKITMRTNVTSNTVNVIFNYLLIGGHFGFPAMGIEGAAIATVLGTVVGAFMSVLSVSKADSFISIPYIIKNKIMPSVLSLKSILKVGYSVFFEQILLRIGFLATAVMAADMGNDAMATHQVCMNIMGLSFSFGDGLQAASVALIGRSLGENDPELAKRYGKACLRIGFCISLAVAVCYLLGGRFIMTMFFKEKPQIIDIGVGILMVIIPVVLFQIRQVVYMGSLRGAGDTLYTAVVSAICVTVIRTAVSYIACYPAGLGIYGIWLGIAADQIIRYLLVMPRFKMGKWAKIKI